MAGVRHLDGSFWQGFRTETDGKNRYFYGNDNGALYLKEKPYFNKSTVTAMVCKGVEVADLSSQEAVSEEDIFLVSVCVRIPNYFGDCSGRHLRSKQYIKIGEHIYCQNEYGKVKEVLRPSKELKGILSELEELEL